MRTKSHLLSAGQTRNPVKSPIRHILLAVALVLLCCIAVPQNVQANMPKASVDMGKKSTCTFSLTWYRTGTVEYRNACLISSDILADARDAYYKDYEKGHPGLTGVYQAYDKELKKLTIKYSKPSIAKATMYDTCMEVELKKAGKTTITVKGKLGRKKINLKINIISYEYDRPFTSFKINGKSYKDAFKIFREYKIPNWDQSIKSLKIQFKFKKDWSLKKESYGGTYFSYWDLVKKSSNTLNFKLVTFPENTNPNYPRCYFTLYNKKSKQTIEYIMYL